MVYQARPYSVQCVLRIHGESSLINNLNCISARVMWTHHLDSNHKYQIKYYTHSAPQNTVSYYVL